MPPLPPSPLMFSNHPSIRPNTLQWCPHSCLRGLGYRDTCQSLSPRKPHMHTHIHTYTQTEAQAKTVYYIFHEKRQTSNIPPSRGGFEKGQSFIPQWIPDLSSTSSQILSVKPLVLQSLDQNVLNK